MKVYVINREEDTERLASFTAKYPSCLPECTVWKAKVGTDVVVPDWWQSTANRWSLVQNFIDILSKDIDDDVLIFEDDCIFADDFEQRYLAFMATVPEDWDMIYLGAQHVAPPIRLAENLLKLNGSICGHAIIYNKRIKKELIDYYKEDNWGCMHMPDQRRAQAMASGKFICYSPVVNLCGQAEGPSILFKKYRGIRWYNEYFYMNIAEGSEPTLCKTNESSIPESIAVPTEDTKCIISMTSYKPRMKYLAEALQGVIGDKQYHVVLTLYKDDALRIPRCVRNWIDDGKLELIVTDTDYRAHKKYKCAFEKYIDKYPVVTIDDDVYNTIPFIESLYQAYLKYPDCVISHRSKQIFLHKKWATVDYDTEPSFSLLPVGMFGILYPIGFEPTFDFIEEFNWDMNDDHSLHAAAVRQNIKSVNVKGKPKEIMSADVRNSAWWHTHLPLAHIYTDFYMKDIVNGLDKDKLGIES